MFVFQILIREAKVDISLILGINVGFKNTKPHIPSSNTMDVINSFSIAHNKER